MNYINIFGIIVFLAFLDITLTHFHFFIQKKKTGKTDLKEEKNILPRTIMLNNPNPKNYLLGITVTLTILITTMIMSLKYSGNTNMLIWMSGVYTLIIYIHTIQLKEEATL